MKKTLLLALLFSYQLFAFDKMPEPYLVQYGTKKAPLHIIQYYSFTCPYCVAHFREQFQQIKEDYIDRGRVCWIFHPVPMDLLTVQGMECLSKLPDQEKKIFLEAVLEELVIDQPTLSAKLMQKGMELLGNPIKDLQDKTYLSETAAFQEAFQFLKEADAIEALPSVDVNGEFFCAQVPDIAFIEDQLFRMRGCLLED